MPHPELNEGTVSLHIIPEVFSETVQPNLFRLPIIPLRQIQFWNYPAELHRNTVRSKLFPLNQERFLTYKHKILLPQPSHSQILFQSVKPILPHKRPAVPHMILQTSTRQPDTHRHTPSFKILPDLPIPHFNRRLRPHTRLSHNQP